VYFVYLGDEAQDLATRLAEDLRRVDVPCDMSFGGHSLKGQMRRANALGARWAAIIGGDEVAARQVTLRSMEAGQQTTVAADDLVRRVKQDCPSGSPVA
jgi:histidyl-tRNA synthetase